MTDQLVQELPEEGQLVSVRNRQYVVASIHASQRNGEHETLEGKPTTEYTPQHLVSLISVEDDGLGETLEVIWEIEPSAWAIEKGNLPNATRLDDPATFRAFLDAVRWGAISAEDTRQLQAPFRSGIEPKDYQLDPLVRAIQMPRVNQLIADDVGLGKTIEAGLVIQELIVRSRIRTALIVCPSGLQIHWRDQMRDKFGLEFRIVNSATMKELRRNRGLHVNPWAHFPRLITSIDYLKRERPLRLFQELLPNETTYPRTFDMLVVDEAHNVAPSGSLKYAVDSLRTRAIQRLAPHFEHKLFLSATPHNGYAESFTALLELLDNQRFARGVYPNRRLLSQVMVRRLKSDPDFVNPISGEPLFPQRRLVPLEVEYSEKERAVHQWLRNYSKLRQDHAQNKNEAYVTEFVLKLLKKRLFSSPAAFADTLAKHEQTLDRYEHVETQAELATAKRRSTPQVSVLRKQIDELDDSYADDDEYESAAEVATSAASAHFAPLSPEERSLLKQMRTWAESARSKGDAKVATLIDWLRAIVKPKDGPKENGGWSDERVIIFTEYRATQKWLQDRFVSAGLADPGRLAIIYGGMDSDDRELVKAAFQSDPRQSPVRILLATDAASEGIDLQKYCHRLVHIEIPWNPNRLEQRNGRIDRHGQRFEPEIYHFVARGYQQRLGANFSGSVADLDADLEFLMRAAQKIETIREDLGKVGPVIAGKVEAAMLGKRRDLDTQTAEAEAQQVRTTYAFERRLQEDIQRFHKQRLETQQSLGITPQRVEAVVQTALAMDEQQPLQPTDKPGVFHVPPLRGSWQYCVDGLAHPHTQEIRPITFDPAHVDHAESVVLAHLNHRLVQKALRLLRAEVWSPNAGNGLQRMTARVIPDHLFPDGVSDEPVVIGLARLVITGGDQNRLHEEIIMAGGELRLQNQQYPFLRIDGVGRIADLYDAATLEAVSPAVQNALLDLWPRVQPNLVAALENRMQTRTKNYEESLLERAQKQADNIESVLNELATTIRGELNTFDQPVQMEMKFKDFNDDERNQLTRDVAALRRRLDQIPTEIAREKEAIINRVLDPTPRLFPVAVMFLVPERMK